MKGGIATEVKKPKVISFVSLLVAFGVAIVIQWYVCTRCPCDKYMYLMGACLDNEIIVLSYFGGRTLV